MSADSDGMTATPLRPTLLLVPVARQEGWPSIDLCGEMLAQQLAAGPGQPWTVRTAGDDFPYRWMTLGRCVGAQRAMTIERLWTRFSRIPHAVRREARHAAVVHLVDHSYSHLIPMISGRPTGVLCHDLDTFRCLLEPASEPRSWLFRRMTRKILEGMRQAGVVFHTTQFVRAQILDAGLVPAERLVQAPLGIASEFVAAARLALGEVTAASLPATPGPASSPSVLTGSAPYLLHVGSCIPRKRIDVLLDVVAGVRSRCPGLRFVKIGGDFTAEQRQHIERLGLAAVIEHHRFVDRAALTAWYAGAAATLITSDREGFGLPVIEALACGSPVIASSIPPMREGGGTVALYCPVGDRDAWIETATRLIHHPDTAPPERDRRQQALRFTWSQHAAVISTAYQRLLAGQPVQGTTVSPTEPEQQSHRAKGSG